MNKRKIAVVLVIIAQLGFTGCTDMEVAKESARSTQSVQVEVDTQQTEITDETEGETEGQIDLSVIGRTGVDKVRNAELLVEVANFDGYIERIKSKTESLDAFIENYVSELKLGGSKGDDYKEGSIVLKVPSGEFDNTLKFVKQDCQILREEHYIDDVTPQYIEVRSRVKARKQEMDNLWELMASTDDLTSLLEIEKRIAELKTQVEEDEAKIRSWDALVLYSTIDIKIKENKSLLPKEEDEAFVTQFTQAVGESAVLLGSLVSKTLIVAASVSIPLGTGLLVVAVVKKVTKKEKKNTSDK